MRSALITMREEKGLSREALARALDVDVRTVRRWETGESEPQLHHKVALAELYGRPLADVLRAVNGDAEAAINGHQVPAHLTHFASCEQGASELRSWEPLVIPGLLQTSDYAAAVERTSIANPGETAIADRVKLRLWRQGVLTRPGSPLRLFVVVDASTLLRTVGGPAVMTAQRAHLAEMAALPNVAVRVAPLDGVPAAGWGAFHLLTGDGHAPYTAVTEDLSGFHYHELPFLVRSYTDLFERLWESSHALAEEHLLGR